MRNDLAMGTAACLAVLGLVTMAAAGCDGRGGTCQQPAACGGNVVGTWKTVSSCLSLSAMGLSGCPDGTVTLHDVSITGTTTLNDDMTFTQSFGFSGTESAVLPNACLKVQGMPVTCSEYEAMLQSSLAATGGGGTFTAVSCRASAASCNCTFTLDSGAKAESGTYSTVNNVLSQTIGNGPFGTATATGTLDASDYCVKGSSLVLTPHLDMTMPMPMGSVQTISANIVLSKQ